MTKDQKTKARVLFLDIEATALVADFGKMLMCGFKWADEEKPFILSMLDYGDGMGDKKLTAEVVKVINTADVIVTWYGARYDIPFINTRVLRTGTRNFIGLPAASHIDLWRTSRYKLKLRSNRLASVIDYLQLDNEKTPVKGPQWMDAQKCPTCYPKEVKAAMSYIDAHCKKDVLALEEAYHLLLPLVENHPRIKQKPIGRDACANCGSDDIQYRGYSSTTSALRKPRFQCKACGKWDFGAVYAKGIQIV